MPHLLEFRSSHEHICSLIASSLTSPPNPSAGDDIELFVGDLQQQAQAVYPLLLQLGASIASAAASLAKGQEIKEEEGAQAALIASTSAPESERVTILPPNGLEGDTHLSDLGPAANKTSKQERNTYALTVLRRIKCKLDGKDRWPGKERDTKQSVVEQVESVIKQACSIDNLCELYEGWAAWI